MDATEYILALRKLRVQYGDDALLDPKRVRGFLMDSKLPSPGHVRVLAAAVEDGLVQELLQPEALDDPVIAARLISRLQSQHLLTKENAEWVILTWLSVLSPSDWQANLVAAKYLNLSLERECGAKPGGTAALNWHTKEILPREDEQRQKEERAKKFKDELHKDGKKNAQAYEEERAKRFKEELHKENKKNAKGYIDNEKKYLNDFLTDIRRNKSKWDKQTQIDIDNLDQLMQQKYLNNDWKTVSPTAAQTYIGKQIVGRINKDIEHMEEMARIHGLSVEEVYKN